jgi:saccharopine dehydrogenase (NAD+, L-lysine forming)
MIEANERKTILVLGGYGAVGSAVCTELASTFAGRIIVAGRNLQQARRLAQQLGGRVEAMHVDAAQPAAYRDLLSQTSVVVNCVEHNNVTVARECLLQAAHYVEVSATAQVLAQIETLQAEAARGRATAVLSVGVAPGLTNLLAQHARSRLGPLARADLFVLLGLGKAHGGAAIRWMLQNMGRPFTLGSGDTGREVRPFVEGRATRMPPLFGRRTAYRFDFSDQHTLPTTLGINVANTWLCFDSRPVTRLLWLLARLRLLSIYPSGVRQA